MFVRRIFADSTAATLLALSLAMLLSLQSYSSADLLGNSAAISNFLGKAGAHFADTMFYTFGYASYLLTALLLIYSLSILARKQKHAQIYLGMRIVSVLGIVLASFSFAALLQLHHTESTLPRGAGGTLGLHTARQAYEYLSFSGATCALLVCAALGSWMLSGCTWFELCERVGRAATWPVRLLSARPQPQPTGRRVQPTRTREEAELAYQQRLREQAQHEALVAAQREAEARQQRMQEEADIRAAAAAEAAASASMAAAEAAAEAEPSQPPMPAQIHGAYGLDDNMPMRRAFSSDDGAADAQRVSLPPQFLQQRGGAWGKSWPEAALTATIDAHEHIQGPAPTLTPSADSVAVETTITTPQVASAPAEPVAESGAAFSLAPVMMQRERAELTINPDDAAINAAFDSSEEVSGDGFVNRGLDASAAQAQRVPSPTIRKPSGISSNNNSNPSSLFQIPSTEFLTQSSTSSQSQNSEYELSYLGRNLEARLSEYGIEAKVVSANPGPVVTRFELDLAAGVKVARVVNIAKDLARSLAVASVRVVEIIPGKSHIGIEVPNKNRTMVRLREVLESASYQNCQDNLTLALGVDIEGKPVITNLAKMPHLLVAGTTGSGKSVGVNAMLLSLLYKATPEQVRLILIDPKMLELSVYNDIPHLLTEVIVDMNNAARGLRWCVMEMERRYQLMSKLGVRNLDGFNDKLRSAAEPIYDPLWDEQGAAPGEQPERLKPLPQIVVVVDEYADLMMTVGKKVEELIARIAQKARAAGIHLILATQRPSVDVITGLIKANIPARIGYQVSSKIDSRTILDQGGSEQLLGHGDMLFLSGGTAAPTRVHGAFVSDAEVHRVTNFWRQQRQADSLLGAPLKLDNDEDLEAHNPNKSSKAESDPESGEPLYDAVVDFVISSQRVSISSVQRKFKIGYNRAARIIDIMEASGLVSPMETNGKRDVLVEQHA